MRVTAFPAAGGRIFSDPLIVQVREHYSNPTSVAVLVEMEVVKIKCFLVCGALLSDPLERREQRKHGKPVWS